MLRGGRSTRALAPNQPLSLWGRHPSGASAPGEAGPERSTTTAPAGEGQDPTPRFPYATWGPGLAIGGVLVAIGVGIIVGIPAFIFGLQSGSVERFSPPTYRSGAAIRSGEDSVAVAVDAAGTVYSDDGSSVVAVTRRGALLPGTPFGEFADSEGIAFDSTSHRLYISERSAGRIGVYRVGRGHPRLERSIDRRALPAAQRDDFEPQAMVIPHPGGELYAIDRGNEAVDRFSAAGAYLGRITDPDFDFSSPAAENGVALAGSGDPNAPHLYVVSRGEGESGQIWAFGRGSTLLWKGSPPDGHHVCGVAGESGGRIWIADSRGGIDQYGLGGPGAAHLNATGKSAPAGSRACAVAVDASGALYAGRAPEPLTATANVVVQLATALGFLLVPIGISMMSGGGSIVDALGRLGIRRFRPSAIGWMAATVAAYLAFSIAYASLVVEPRQKDIAEGFGTLPFQILLISFAAPISEEVCFRGMLFGGLRTRLPAVGAALLSGVIFGVLHAITGITAVPPLIVLGFLFALLYDRTGSVLPGILLHVLNNSVALLGQ